MIRNCISFTFGIVFLFSNFIFAEQPPVERWVARYDGSANNIDQAYDIAVDNAGNIYVTGQSWGGSTASDYATIKYDPAGNQLWVARYNGDGNNLDIPYAIAVDSTGNVYVTGESWGNGTAHDYATIKYDTNGNQLWAARYSSAGWYSDMACALAVDSSGNVCVTGSSGGSEIAYNYVTIKYDANGVQKWASRYSGPQNYDEASAIAVDNSGNVYVTGKSYGSGTGCDYATVKYNANGTQLWESRYTWSGGDYDAATALAIDSSANVYVTGISYGGSSRYDYATLKYNSSGTVLWAKRYNGPANKTDEAYALAVDNSGNVYVTGSSDGDATGKDYATIKYNASGTQLWVARYNGPANDSDIAYALAVDNYGNVYVTGYKYSGVTGEGYEDYATIKYDSSGNQLWVAYYNGPANRTDVPAGLAIDNSGNIYVTGCSAAGIGDDYATIKYTQHNYCTQAISGDINGNCKIDFADYAMLAENWLTENDWNDLADLADNWLLCGFALSADCW